MHRRRKRVVEGGSSEFFQDSFSDIRMNQNPLWIPTENIFLNVPKIGSKPAVLVVKGNRPLILQKEVLIMPRKRKEIPELEKMLQYGKKKFVRYDEGAKLYSMGLHSFQDLAREAGAVYHVKRVVLVNTQIIDEYLESFKD